MFLINPYIFDSYVYLVDTYSPTVAFSFRKLSSSATNCLRVRRSSDNAEQDIGFTGNGLDTASLTSFCSGTNGFVVTWYDQSGNGHNVTQSTSTRQPAIVVSGSLTIKGGNPAMSVDGSDDYLAKGSAALNTTSTSYFAVSASITGGTFGVVMTQSASTNRTARVFQDARTTPNRNLVVANVTPGTNYFADLSTARNDTNQRLVCSFIDASKNMSAFDNGATGGTATYTGTFTSNNLVIGADPASPIYSAMYIQEFIGFNTDETSNRNDIETNINDYYSIY